MVSRDFPSLAPASAKRRKVEDDDSGTGPTKKPRTRVSFSCGECHRRKQKCDRQMPCSHCIARKVPELCKAYTPGKSDQDINARLVRLEQIIESALPQYCTPSTPASYDGHNSRMHHRSPSAADDDPEQGDEQDPHGGSFQSGKWYGNSASGSIAPGSVLEQLQHAVSSPVSRDYAQGSSGDLIYPDVKPLAKAGSGDEIPNAVKRDLEPSAADNLKILIQECGVSPHKISELLQELPPKRTSDVLIDYYFKSINWTRYPISEKDFRASYSSIAEHGAHGIGATNPTDVRFLPLLFVVLAISVRLAAEDIAGDVRARRLTSLRYYWCSRRAMLIAAAIQPDSLEIVLSRLLSARYLTFDRRITECWSQLGAAVRTAQALGLHRDGSSMGMDPAQVEYRRRIWSYLYHADRSYALALGRPNSIQDDYTSTRSPSNIDDDSPSPQNLPLFDPTPMTFVILRHQLASIIGHIVHHFQKVRASTQYSEVADLDDELLNFIARLPPHFALEPDRSLDESLQYVPVHRYLLITEILFVRTSLHRPYILRKLESDRYARSRAACFESAIKDFQVRQAFRETMPKDKLDSLSNAYREFQTAMISGIYLVIEPTGRDATAMHTILDAFLKEHEGLREIDETTRRELKTIEFLKTKALQRAQEAAPNGNGDLPPDNPAQLLLHLHNRDSMPSPFPSLFSLPPAQNSPQSPTAPYNGMHPKGKSPTFHRLQTSQDFANSPANSASPSTEEDHTAQSLLDHWCNTISNTPMDAANPSLSWGGPGGADFSGWVSAQGAMGGSETSILSQLDSSPWNYWEALVNQIPRQT